MTANNLDELFQSLINQLPADRLAGLDSTIQFCLSGKGGGDWLLEIAAGKVQVERGIAKKTDTQLETSGEDFIGMITGSPEEIGWAFMQGRFNMTGDLMKLWRVLALLREVYIDD